MLTLVDTNEQSTAPKIVDQLRKVFKMLNVVHLDCGDVNVITDTGKVFAVERKTPNDLLASISDGRLFDQVERMSVHAWSVIIVTGHITYDDNDMIVADGQVTNWRGVSVRNAIAACCWSGCPVIFTSQQNYANTIRELLEFTGKPPAHVQFRKHRYVTFPPIEQSTDLLAQFPGIGITLAESMLGFVGNNGEIGSLAAAIEWGSMCGLTKDNSRPEGWGDKKIANFRAALGLRSDQYLVIRSEGVLENEDS